MELFVSFAVGCGASGAAALYLKRTLELRTQVATKALGPKRSDAALPPLDVLYAARRPRESELYSKFCSTWNCGLAGARKTISEVFKP
ncbi:hypothetical protein M885DRAFT_610465 [Pelagophyceae sp. CCMP2097]|nr:hypothetical protein M885DRAFT_610465 [Pelagophyceae sp. CCMP2097]|mmetsp:Transcript_27038/g.90862  ORF Transcript_27038/g.90862 Transcript_27038/m.90862 type:complete len:88 (-) Transcript_27038:147-410(-)